MTRYADVHIRLLTAFDGGRQTPIFSRGGLYRPRMRVGPDNEYLGVAFVSGPASVTPGEEVDVTVALLYDIDYFPLQPEAEFEVLEVRRVVANGIVLRRWESNRPWHSWPAA